MEQQLQDFKTVIRANKLDEISKCIQQQKQDRDYTLRQFLLHALPSNGESFRIGQTPLLFACTIKPSLECLHLLLETGVQEGIIVDMLLSKSATQDTCITLAANSQMSGPSFHLLLQYCEKHLSSQTVSTETLKRLLESVREDKQNCIMMAATQRLNEEAFVALLHCCSKYTDITNRLLHAQDRYGCTAMMRATSSRLDADTFSLLVAHFPSHQSFRWNVESLKCHDDNAPTAVDVAQVTRQTELFSDPTKCWKKSVKLYRDFAGGEFPENERKRRNDFVDKALPKNDDGGCVLQ